MNRHSGLRKHISFPNEYKRGQGMSTVYSSRSLFSSRLEYTTQVNVLNFQFQSLFFNQNKSFFSNIQSLFSILQSCVEVSVLI